MHSATAWSGYVARLQSFSIICKQLALGGKKQNAPTMIRERRRRDSNKVNSIIYHHPFIRTSCWAKVIIDLCYTRIVFRTSTFSALTSCAVTASKRVLPWSKKKVPCRSITTWFAHMHAVHTLVPNSFFSSWHRYDNTLVVHYTFAYLVLHVNKLTSRITTRVTM
jgi:hypothetical protein